MSQNVSLLTDLRAGKRCNLEAIASIEQLESELTALRAERDAYKNALWKACGDDKENVDSYLECVGFKKEGGK